ncbi:hypothetical protein BDC45DRAFT_535988 [Circinella umbellata]|nr:hypothetical protein BDC45DRAFT_535988 [Circinella umbellata]
MGTKVIYEPMLAYYTTTHFACICILLLNFFFLFPPLNDPDFFDMIHFGLNDFRTPNNSINESSAIVIQKYQSLLFCKIFDISSEKLEKMFGLSQQKRKNCGRITRLSSANNSYFEKEKGCTEDQPI